MLRSAVYNITLNDVVKIMETAGAPVLGGTLGTNPLVILEALNKAGFAEITNQNSTTNYDSVIVLFGFPGGAHYVAVISNGDGTYTFHNVYTNNPTVVGSLSDFCSGINTKKGWSVWWIIGFNG